MRSRRFCDQPLRTVEGAGGFLAAGQRQLERAQRAVFLRAVANQRVDPDGRLGLVVDAAARVEVAVLLDQLERIAGPVLALGLDHVDVREQQDRLELRIATGIDGDQAALLGMIRRGEELQLRCRRSRPP